jgi:hypothetical protein
MRTYYFRQGNSETARSDFYRCSGPTVADAVAAGATGMYIDVFLVEDEDFSAAVLTECY